MSAHQKNAKRWDDRPGPFMRRRYPTENLVRFAVKRWRPTADEISEMMITDAGKVASVLDISASAVQRMIGRGSISSRDADRYAVKVLGVHPSAIWPDWFDEKCLTESVSSVKVEA